MDICAIIRSRGERRVPDGVYDCVCDAPIEFVEVHVGGRRSHGMPRHDEVHVNLWRGREGGSETRVI